MDSMDVERSKDRKREILEGEVGPVAKKSRLEGDTKSPAESAAHDENAPLVNGKLTADEFNLYDRQIRLWGVEAQKKLRKCNALVIGLNGTGILSSILNDV